MPRTAQQRASAYAQKTDPSVSYRRTKWGRQLWIENYIFAGFDPADLDSHIAFKQLIYNMGFAEKQQFDQMFRRLYALYPNMRESEKETLKAEWISSGLTEVLFDNAWDFCVWVYELPKPRYLPFSPQYFYATLTAKIGDQTLESALDQTVIAELV